METHNEHLARDYILESSNTQIPSNQLGMTDYYNVKIRYLRDAINLLELQIKEYLRERSMWDICDT
jgi:hypothetical protein